MNGRHTHQTKMIYVGAIVYDARRTNLARPAKAGRSSIRSSRLWASRILKPHSSSVSVFAAVTRYATQSGSAPKLRSSRRSSSAASPFCRPSSSHPFSHSQARVGSMLLPSFDHSSGIAKRFGRAARLRRMVICPIRLVGAGDQPTCRQRDGQPLYVGVAQRGQVPCSAFCSSSKSTFR